MAIEEAPNFRRMGERVTTSGLVTESQLRGLADAGCDVVVDLLPHDHEQAVRDESRIVAKLGMDYVHIPVDFAAPTRSDVDAFVDALDANDGRTLHIHCAANYRVSAFYAVHLWRKGSCSAADAEAIVRDVWDPSAYPVWERLLADELGSDPSTHDSD